MDKMSLTRDKIANRPFTTMFMLMSADGKISTGDKSYQDFEVDFLHVPTLKAGLPQYYSLETETDLWSITTGATQQKVLGLGFRYPLPKKVPITQVVFDNKHLTRDTILYLCDKYDRVVVITLNSEHVAMTITRPNITVLKKSFWDLSTALRLLYNEYACRNITIQCGSTVNSEFFKEQLVDRLSIVVAPTIIGGSSTPGLVGGLDSLWIKSRSVPILSLKEINNLEYGYVNLIYDVSYESKQIHRRIL